MPIQLIFEASAIRDLKRVPGDDRDRILARLDAYSREGPADIKRLVGRDEFRMRVGNYRVLFVRVGDTVSIRRIVHRKDAYR